MGMESFFRKVFCSNTNQNNVNPLLERLFPFATTNGSLGTRVQQKRLLKGQHIIADTVVVSYNENGEGVEVCMSACFSNFLENIKRMHTIAFALSGHFTGACLMFKDTSISVANVDLLTFQTIVLEFYKEKYNYFVSKYGEMQVDLLPNEDFYMCIGKARGCLGRRYPLSSERQFPH